MKMTYICKTSPVGLVPVVVCLPSLVTRVMLALPSGEEYVVLNDGVNVLDLMRASLHGPYPEIATSVKDMLNVMAGR